MGKKRVLSGIQPSGQLHLGNYFGMMSRMIQYQENNDLFCFIANYHALTSTPEKEALSSNTFEAACDFLALGLDPKKSTFWIQSDVPEVTELTWILSNVTPMGLMDRATSYKDKTARGLSANLGLFAYPVLMAADILIFNPSLEYCIDISKFHSKSKNSPFDGWKVKGKVLHTLVKGKTAYSVNDN